MSVRYGMRPRLTLSRAFVMERTWPFFIDLSVAAALLAGFYAILWVAKFWFSSAIPEVEIHRSPVAPAAVRVLFGGADLRGVRAEPAVCCGLRLHGGVQQAAGVADDRDAGHPAVDPGAEFSARVMLAMMSLFPSRQLGIEFGAILLIFTGEVWNMAFSFYTSLKSIPRELMEATEINRFSRLQRLFQLELPFGAIGLVWNSIVSVANGWFFLMVCEMFPGGRQEFPAAGAGIVSADGGVARRLGSDDVGTDHDGADHRDHRPAVVAAADRVVGQVQVRDGGERAIG